MFDSGLRRVRLAVAVLVRQKLPCEDRNCSETRRAVSLLRVALEPADASGNQIAALAAHLHAVTYELLVLLREFDEPTAWDGGLVTCAHWLHWRTGIALGVAREKVCVALV